MHTEDGKPQHNPGLDQEHWSPGDTSTWLTSRRRFLKKAAVVVLAALAALSPRRPSERSGGASYATMGPGRPRGRPDHRTVTPHGTPLRGIDQTNEDRGREGRFGLMFKHLDPFRPSDALLAGLAGTMIDRATGPAREQDNPEVAAGYIYVGQFLDHDITFDTTPLDDQERDPKALHTYRSARYDLDCVYGGGRRSRPELYDPTNLNKLRIGGGGGGPDDLPRDGSGRAILGDPRNDENLLIAQLHLAFLKFHNRLVDHLGGGEVFEEAQRLVRWHWQWVVVHDFLPNIVDPAVVASVLDEGEGRPAKAHLRFYKPKNPNKPMLPVEHTVAAYRYGHSQVRSRYRVNPQSVPFIFGREPGPDNLNGGRPLPPELVVEWKNLFDVRGQPPAARARKIDPILSAPLFELPDPPPPSELRSLAERNLKRGSRVGLPSGQDVALAMGLQALTNAELGMPDDPGWEDQAPLWYYVLKEAELAAGGRRLGPVGGRIVAEVLVGLLLLDRTSYLSRKADFTPEPPIAPEPGKFLMVDLLRFAGVL